MSKILEQYKRLKMMRKESIRANAPLLPEEPKEKFILKSYKSLKNTRPKITSTVTTIVQKKGKREFKDIELEKKFGEKAKTIYLDEEMSKRFVCDGAVLICKHLKIAERLILRVTDRGAMLQGGNPIATEDDVLPENFEFQYSPYLTRDNFGNSNGIVTEKTRGLCDVTGDVCVIQNAYWTKMAKSILNNGKAMIFDTSELYCTVDESSPITVEYNGQDFSKFEGGWNSLTRTHKNNPVLYNFSKSILLIYLGDDSRGEDLLSSVVSYIKDKEIKIYSEIGYIGPSIDMYENTKDFGKPVIEGISNGVKEYKKGVEPHKLTGKSKSVQRNILRNDKGLEINGEFVKIKKGQSYNEFIDNIDEEVKKIKHENLKNIAKNTGKNILMAIPEKVVDKVMVDYNSLIPTEARYNQSIDYFNKVYYIDDYTKKVK